jgi:membrane protein
MVTRLVRWLSYGFSKATRLARLTWEKWSTYRVPQLGASLAFYTALSIAPLLVICLAIGAFAFGDEAARGEIATQIKSLVGNQGAEAIQQMIKNADKPASGTAATVLGLVMLFLGASGVFSELQQSLNIIWEVQPQAGRGLLGIIRDRFFSFVMVLGIAFLLLVSLVLSALLASLGTFFSALPASVNWLTQFLNFAVSFAVITFLFAMIFKILPDARIAWRQVWLGAVFTALLFTIGKFFIGLYLGQSSMASSYGVAGSFVVLLVWVYYSSQILYLGAAITKVVADESGSTNVPARNAVRASPAGRRIQEA